MGFPVLRGWPYSWYQSCFQAIITDNWILMCDKYCTIHVNISMSVPFRSWSTLFLVDGAASWETGTPFTNMDKWLHVYSYTLSHEYGAARNWYSQLLFISEDHLWANLHEQEQSTNKMPAPHICMMSQTNCGDVTTLTQKRQSILMTTVIWAIDNCFKQICVFKT